MSKGHPKERSHDVGDQNQEIRINPEIIVRIKETSRSIVESFKRSYKAWKVIPQKDLKAW